MMAPRVPKASPDHEPDELGTLSIAIYDFEGEREDMLRFKEGDIITIIEMNSNGWWKGATTNGKVGIFPYSYVEVKVTKQDSFPYARAIYALPPNESDPEQLSFEEDEVITVIKELNSDWSFGRRDNGDEGRFPTKYIEYTGDYNEALFKKETEKWEKLEAEKKKEENKILEEKAALEKKFLEQERYKKEENLKNELDKFKKEAEDLKKQNEEQLLELKKQKEEFLKMKRDLLIRQERARRELDQAKAEAGALRKLQERRDARKSRVVANRVDEESLRIQARVTGIGRDFSNFAPGPPPEVTPEVLDIEEDPFSKSKKKKKKFSPIVKVVYNSKKQTEKPKVDPEALKKIDKQREIEAEKAKLNITNETKTELKQDIKKKPNKVLKKFANLGKGQGCKVCGKSVGLNNRVKACNVIYHTDCFRCSTCNKIMRNGEYVDNNNFPYCRLCHKRGFGPKGFGMGGAMAGTGKTGAEVNKDGNKEVTKGKVVTESWV